MKNRKTLPKFVRVLLAVVGLLTLRFVFFRAPSEAEMIAKFQRHKAEFEQIRLMLRQDRNIETIGPDWVETEWTGNARLPLNVPEGRISLYRARLKGLGFSRVDRYKGHVQLEEFGGGFTDTSWGIGYVWSSTTPVPLVKSAYNQMPMRERRHFSRLEGNWYIYHRR